jgi:hypothetical protein
MGDLAETNFNCATNFFDLVNQVFYIAESDLWLSRKIFGGGLKYKFRQAIVGYIRLAMWSIKDSDPGDVNQDLQMCMSTLWAWIKHFRKSVAIAKGPGSRKVWVLDSEGWGSRRRRSRSGDL